MANTVTRRPLPALIALLALLLLTALVWWRVLHRSDAKGTHHVAAHCTTSAPTTLTLPAPSSITIAVLNATHRTGIAAQARSTLVNDGFKSPAVAGNDTQHLNKVKGTAEIRFGPTAKNGATLLRYYLPGAAMVPVNTKSTTVVVALGTKYKSVASAAAVRTALARDKVGVAGSTKSASPSSSASC